MNRSHTVARNMATTLGAQIVSWALTFVVTLYLPRYIGDRGLGAITLAGSFASLFSLMVALGTSTVLVKEIARRRTQAGPLLLAALASRLPLGLLAVGLGWGATFLLGYGPALRWLIVVALVAMALAQAGDALASALRGLEEFPRQNFAGVVEKLLLAVLTILLVLAHAPLWTFVGVGALTTLVSIAINFGAFRLHLHAALAPTPSEIKSLTAAGLPFLTTAVFVAIYGQADALLLSKLSTLAAIGWYGLAKRLGGTTLMLPSVLCGVMLPNLSRQWQEDREAFAAAVRRLFNVMFLCVVPFAAVLTLAPAQILTLLHYPASFRHSIPVLMIMGVAVVLWYLSQVAGTALIACDRQGVLSRITGVSAMLSVPVCAAAIWLTQRWFANGAIGAMLSDALIEAYMVAAYLRALPEGVFSWRQLAVLGRALAAAAPLAGLFYFVHSKAGLLMLIPGLLLYVPLCALLRCLHPQDVQMVRNLWRKRLHA